MRGNDFSVQQFQWESKQDGAQAEEEVKYGITRVGEGTSKTKPLLIKSNATFRKDKLKWWENQIAHR